MVGDGLAAVIAIFGILVVFRVTINAFDALLVIHGLLDRGDGLGESVPRPVHHVVRRGDGSGPGFVCDVILDRSKMSGFKEGAPDAGEGEPDERAGEGQEHKDGVRGIEIHEVDEEEDEEGDVKDYPDDEEGQTDLVQLGACLLMVRIIRVQDRRGFEIHGRYLDGLIIDHEKDGENGMKSKKLNCYLTERLQQSSFNQSTPPGFKRDPPSTGGREKGDMRYNWVIQARPVVPAGAAVTLNQGFESVATS